MTILTSCTLLRGPSGLPTPEDIVRVEETGNKAKDASAKSANLMAYLFNVGLVVGVVTLALSLKFPGALHISGIAFVTAGTAYTVLLALPWLYAVGWILLAAVVCWGLWFLLKRTEKWRDELDKKDNILKEVCEQFDNPTGRDNLSKEADDAFVSHTDKNRKARSQ